MATPTESIQIGLENYEEYIVKPMREYCDILHQAGKYKFAHAIGYPIGRFPGSIRRSQVDVLMGYKRATLGSSYEVVTLCDAWWNIGPILMGGVDTDLLYRLPTSEIEAIVKDVLRYVDRAAKFILSTSSAVLEGTPIENLKVIGELVK